MADSACTFLVCHCPSSFCSAPLQRVSEVSNHWWYSMLILPPLLKDSVAAPLLSAYYPDCVGMSPSCTSTHRAASDTSPGKLEHSKAVPSVLGESWSWPSLLSLLPPPLPWKYVGEQNGKDFFFNVCSLLQSASLFHGSGFTVDRSYHLYILDS